MNSRNYGGLIWTNHALDRLEARKLPQDIAWSAFKYPDKVISGKVPGSREYQKHFRGSLITLIAKPGDRGESIVLSCWIDPPLPGTMDERKQKDWKEYKKASWLKKWWLVIKRSLGI
jgi:hypothetical protein